MIGLTPRQRDILSWIKGYYAREGVAPTLNEIAEQFGFSTVTAFGHVRALEKKGYLRRVRGKVRAIEIIEPDESRPRSSVPVYGYFSQGEPLQAATEYEDFELRSFLPPGKDLFVIRVRGESLMEAGIRDGDYLILERRPRPESGSTALVLANGSEAVLGRLFREGEARVRIEPVGSGRPTLRAGRSLLQGVVLAVVRRF